MRQFTDDDPSYLEWIAQHPDAFVLNSYRKPTREYLKLHQASCRTVTELPVNGRHWTVDYLKTCGDRTELESWAEQVVDGTAKPCRVCL